MSSYKDIIARIDAENEAAKLALSGFAQYGSHEFIDTRYRNLDSHYAELVDAVGADQATQLLYTSYEKHFG